MVYFPLFVIWLVQLINRTSRAFSFVVFFVVLAQAIFINVGKVHYLCLENKFVRVILDLIWYILLFVWILNFWTVDRRATDPYYLHQSDPPSHTGNFIAGTDILV